MVSTLPVLLFLNITPRSLNFSQLAFIEPFTSDRYLELLTFCHKNKDLSYLFPTVFSKQYRAYFALSKYFGVNERIKECRPFIEQLHMDCV